MSRLRDERSMGRADSWEDPSVAGEAPVASNAGSRRASGTASLRRQGGQKGRPRRNRSDERAVAAVAREKGPQARLRSRLLCRQVRQTLAPGSVSSEGWGRTTGMGCGRPG